MGKIGTDFLRLRIEREQSVEGEAPRADCEAHDAKGDVPDGPLPWWSGFIWVPLLVASCLFWVAVAYVFWRLLT